MSRSRVVRGVASFALVLSFPAIALAQAPPGRVFLPTPETVSIHEFNDFAGLAPGTVIPSGTVIQDLSGHGLHATVQANGAGELTVDAGDPAFDVPSGSNLEMRRSANISGGARVAVDEDGDDYEMLPEDDFSIELYVDREDSSGVANWGILAGTWHSRNLEDDTLGDPDTNGAWYGYGLISVPELIGSPEGWQWILSPVVDGVPRIGFASGPELKPEPVFVIPPGRHYVVLSVDRTQQSALGYVDGVEVTALSGLDPTWSFTTPPGRDHARFLLFTGENDRTMGTFMPSPRGTHIDAVRVQRKALSADEVAEIWGNLLAGQPSPPPGGEFAAVILPSSTNLVVDQCVTLDGSLSAPGPAGTITRYAWSIQGGPLVEGPAVRELSFDAASVGPIEVRLQVTNSASETATALVTLNLRRQEALVRFALRLGDAVLAGDPAIVPRGSVLSLDAGASESLVPLGARSCPFAAGQALPASPIVEYLWDWTGDGIQDAAGALVDTPVLDLVEDFEISLTVRNKAGAESSRRVAVRVVDSVGNSWVFHDTPETILHLEFNERAAGPIEEGAIFPDQSQSGLSLAMVDPSGGNLEAADGAPHFASNRAVAFVGAAAGPRGEVPEDFDLFEMGTASDFTFELYVKPGEASLPEWGDVAGTFRARSKDDPDLESAARYGWGIMKGNQNQPEAGTQGYVWLVCSGLGGAAEKAVGFQLAEGVYSYVACVVDRAAQTSAVYSNGVYMGQVGLDPGWSFETPPDYPHASFYLFTREQRDAEFSNCPPGVTVDALRLQTVALSRESIIENHEAIASGRGADPPAVTRPKFHRGDPNGDGNTNITDGIYVLNYLFLGGPGSTCSESADPNDDGVVNITDGIFLLNYLFLGGPAPAAPGPIEMPCGPDPDEPGSPGDLGCESYDKC